jgi:hypothetical protein
MRIAACIALISLATCPAASIKLAWNPNPPEEEAIYEVKAEEVFGLHVVTAKTPNTTLTLENLKPGVPYFFSIRAENAVSVSDYTPAITGIPLPRYRVTIQKSSSLGVWSDTGTVLTGPAHGSGFFRLKIELDEEQGVTP